MVVLVSQISPQRGPAPENGRYFVDREARWPKQYAQVDEDAQRLWEASERQVGIRA